MLISLSIRDIVLIDALDLDFHAGLGVLTGETGAGKSILLDALGLALGVRADSSLVRPEAAQGIVSTCFSLSKGHPLYAYLQESGLRIETDEILIIRRVIKADGGSRAFLNDQPISVTLLREIAGYLIEVHGQHDERGLLNPRSHRLLLDEFGHIDSMPTSQAYIYWRATEKALATAQKLKEEREQDRDWLEHAVHELLAFAPQNGEEAALAEERTTLQKGARLIEDMEAIGQWLDSTEGAIALLRQAGRRLGRIAFEHPVLGEALESIDKALNEAGEASEKLGHTAMMLDGDPLRLDGIETRLFDLRALARKHRVAPDELSSFTIELKDKLDQIEAGEQGVLALSAENDAARLAYEQSAEALSQARLSAAKRFDQAVMAELPPLKMEAARFKTKIEKLESSQWSAEGFDRVEFTISTNPGADFSPLMKIASGGELSRFMLALKVVLAGEEGTTTIIFDEIDQGVGGAVASAIGERLARLSKKAQLLVITHSPQVAARADQHWLIRKHHGRPSKTKVFATRTEVKPLDKDERLEEIARMLSGTEVTDEARAQASRLLGP
ncbi:MAG: DNA repair protein RecN [Zymomonas mobilis subsp. pomaceae]|uniref:DNA repair protein RecN n=1 Tax=Zymomonas mobilis subsp. pomaceae (strain ATCC 29192 / DSM 22645 / JCM 10191 / CCUG 17912 / NBRC 13757 / NCIMB 11200 / NRRL B-4491 / Barker I) TaxID=579138 RepID=F8ETY8_ZYMMT|nr:DNA repair protein RecN [Zymomonas mobilis]AEI38085.1 DNA repair protein RecN [Zymomonas mobilis subsp. pomaceae ATCC 29192]MDX5949451.1 DNA repair protein RecN [Zymomonas mobilis subsp. pomaceae]GEB89194.1 DNA repair protein RecN [Zymomonas mobilis subsp. pomaceae]